MNLGILRLGFAVFWLIVAGLAIYLAHLAPGPPRFGQFGPQTLDLAAVLGVVLAGWNLVRWFLARRPPTVPENPFQRRTVLAPRPDRPEEYHPEFDFSRNPPRPEG